MNQPLTWTRLSKTEFILSDGQKVEVIPEITHVELVVDEQGNPIPDQNGMKQYVGFAGKFQIQMPAPPKV